MMYFVYLIKSHITGGLYICCTSNLGRRIREYNSGKSSYTSKYRPWKLIYFEGYISKADAFRREHSLKLHAQGLRRLRERLRETLAV